MKKGPNPSTYHPLFAELERKYVKTLDAFMGTVEKYVPSLDGSSASDHAAYLNRAAYYGVVERTASAIVGAMTRKPFILTGNQEFPNNDYGSADVMLQYLIRDLLLGGRVVLLEDVGDDGKAIIRCYDADDIINWSDDYRVIRETVLEQDPDNKFEQITVTRYRELFIDEDGYYRVNLWTSDNKKWISTPQPDMMISGKLLKAFPMQVSTPYDNSWDVYNPPLLVQASLNIDHFKQAIDIGHYAHFMSIPTFTIIGDLATYDVEEDYVGMAAGGGYTESGRRIVQKEVQFHLGSTTSPLHLKAGGEAKYTEVSGSSANWLESRLTGIEDRMYIAGTRLLSSKKGVESVEALQARAGAEGAVLETITNSLQNALNEALEICAQINRTAPQSIELNKDFTPSEMDPAVVKNLLELYVAGAISIEQFTKQLIDGEVIEQPETSVEKVHTSLENTK